MSRYLGCMLCSLTADELAGSAAPTARDGIKFGLAVGGVSHKLCAEHATQVWHIEQALRARLEPGRAAGSVQLRVIDGGRST